MNRFLKEFEITQDHLTLVKAFYIDNDDTMYYGAPAVDIKRPYGNKSVPEDIVQMLGWNKVDIYDTDFDWDNYDKDDHYFNITDEQRDKALKLHDEMGLVLQICCANLSFETGVYIREDDCNSRDWVKKQ